MNLTITLTDTDLSELKEALRISTRDYERAVWSKPGDQRDYAPRILRSRLVLGMANDEREACYDWKATSLDTGVSLGPVRCLVCNEAFRYPSPDDDPAYRVGDAGYAHGHCVKNLPLAQST